MGGHINQRKFALYKRWCKRCGEEYETPSKKSKVCKECYSTRKVKPSSQWHISLEKLIKKIDSEGESA